MFKIKKQLYQIELVLKNS